MGRKLFKLQVQLVRNHNNHHPFVLSVRSVSSFSSPHITVPLNTALIPDGSGIPILRLSNNPDDDNEEMIRNKTIIPTTKLTTVPRGKNKEDKKIPIATDPNTTASSSSISNPSSSHPSSNVEPFIVPQNILHWSAYKNWHNLEYLRTKFSNHIVQVEIGKHYMDPNHNLQDVLFGDLLRYMQRKEKEEDTVNTTAGEVTKTINTGGVTIKKKESIIYLAQQHLFSQIPELGKDCLPFPKGFNWLTEYEGTNGNGLRINCWIGPKGTVTPPHTDPYNNLFCQIVGKKYVRLYNSKERERMFPSLSAVQRNTSTVNCVRNPSSKFAQIFQKVPFYETVLEPGDSLFIPRGWWHYVESLSTSISVNFWWDPPRYTR